MSELINKLLANNIIQRTMTALILAPAFVYAIYQGGVVYAIVVCVLSLIGLYEWLQMVNRKAMEAIPSYIWSILGLLYIGSFAVSALYIRGCNNGMMTMFYITGVVWITDIMAYFGGILIGGPKICPVISPKKTWSGLLSGVLSAIVYGIAFQWWENITFGHYQPYLIAAEISLASQLGDFIESGLKRYFGVKDSGAIIYGHGGVLDRFDGMIAACCFMAILLFKLNIY